MHCHYRKIRKVITNGKKLTRMHSSRMRTGRSLTVCCSLLPGGGGFAWSGGVSAWSWGGSPWSGWVSAWSWGVLPAGWVCLVRGGGSAWSRGVLPGLRGVLPAGGVCLVLRGVLPGPGGGGVCLVPGGSLETPPVNRITDTCKNITLATTSLRPVITQNFFLALTECLSINENLWW